VVAVDDDPDTIELLRAILAGRGVQFVGVTAPGEALATVIGVMPDVLLVDIALPGEDGLSLIRKVRTLSPEKGGRIPAASLTAGPAPPAALDQWRRAGFQRHLSKPFAPDALVSLVDELAGRIVERRASGFCAPDARRVGRRERRRETREGLVC